MTFTELWGDESHRTNLKNRFWQEKILVAPRNKHLANVYINSLVGLKGNML